MIPVLLFGLWQQHNYCMELPTSHYRVLIHYWDELWRRNNVLPFHRSPFASAGSASLCRSSWEWRSTPTSASTPRRLIFRRVCTCRDVKEKERGGQTGNLTFGPHRSAFVCVLSVHSQLNVLNYAEESRLMKDCCQTEKTATMVAQSIRRD